MRTARVLRSERVEPVRVEVVDHLANPVLGGEPDLCDRGDAHTLRGSEHDLRSSPPHHRPQTPAHDPEPSPAFVRGQIAYVDTFSHPPIKTGPTDQVVDATATNVAGLGTSCPQGITRFVLLIFTARLVST